MQRGGRRIVDEKLDLADRVEPDATDETVSWLMHPTPSSAPAFRFAALVDFGDEHKVEYAFRSYGRRYN